MAESEKHAPEHHRLFISLAIPESIRNTIGLAQQEFKSKMGESCATWTKLEQLHMTLKFLGNVPITRIESLRDSVAIALQPFSSLKLKAQGVGAFPQTRMPRVLWIGIDDAGGKLDQIHEAIETATGDFGSEKAGQPFSGHATIARVKHLKTAERKLMSQLIVKLSNEFFGEWIGSEIHFMRSKLSPHGAQHSCVCTFQLLTRAST